MSKHSKAEYYVNTRGHVMTYDVFKALTLEKIWKILNSKKK